MTAKYENMDSRAVADDAHINVLIAKTAMDYLVSQVVASEIDAASDSDMDAFVVYADGIGSRIDDVADALDVLTHRLGKGGERRETEGTGPNAPVSLDLLDRAKDSEHELTLLSGYACAMAEGKASTDHERGIYCAASLVTERAAQIIAELVDVATTINQTAPGSDVA